MRMSYQRIRDILSDLRRVHEEAAACCGAEDGVSDERLRLLAEFFRDGEARLAARLKKAEEGARAEVLDTWVQFVPTGGVDKALQELRAATEDGPDPTLASCLTLHGQIAEMLRHLAEMVPAEEAREMLQHLADMEEQAIRELSLANTMREDG